MKLPFLKKKQFKAQMMPTDTKLVNGSQDEMLDDRYMSELFEAAEKGDVKSFRSALEAYVNNMFDMEQHENV